MEKGFKEDITGQLDQTRRNLDKIAQALSTLKVLMVAVLIAFLIVVFKG